MIALPELIRDVKTLLEIESDIYDEKISVLVSGAVSKLKGEGIDHEIIPENDLLKSDFTICVAHQVACDIDLGIDTSRLERQYLQRVVTLKAAIRNVS